MGFSRKLKRKPKIEQEKADIAKGRLAAREIKAEEAGRLMVVKNRQRIQDYSNTYMRIAVDYVMLKTFGFGKQRLERLRGQMKEFFWMLNPNDKKHPHPEWLTAEDIRSGFMEDCEYEFPFRKREATVKDKLDATQWATAQAFNASAQVADDYECVLLWVLHTAWGFGKQRMARCSVAIRKVEKMPSELFNKMIEELERCLKRKYDDVRSVMESLSIDGVHPCEGLHLI